MCPWGGVRFNTEKKENIKYRLRTYCLGVGLLTTTLKYEMIEFFYLIKAVYGIFHTRGDHDLRPVLSCVTVCVEKGVGGMLLPLGHPSATPLQWRNHIIFLQYIFVFL